MCAVLNTQNHGALSASTSSWMFAGCHLGSASFPRGKYQSFLRVVGRNIYAVCGGNLFISFSLPIVSVTVQALADAIPTRDTV